MKYNPCATVLRSAYLEQTPSLFQVKLSASLAVMDQGFPMWRHLGMGMNSDTV